MRSHRHHQKNLVSTYIDNNHHHNRTGDDIYSDVIQDVKRGLKAQGQALSFQGQGYGQGLEKQSSGVHKDKDQD